MADEEGRQREGMGAWMNVMAAFKEAVEETLEDVRRSGDFSQDRTKQAVRDVMRRAQEAVDQTRERLDMVPRREFETLRQEVASLREALAALQRRVAELEYGGAEEGPPIEVE